MPNVRWFMNGLELQGESKLLKNVEIVENTLIYSNLKRSDLRAIIECRASNFNASADISTIVNLDMNCKFFIMI